MPNTRADLERLKHRLETEIYLEPYIAELLALAERLLAERTDARDHACKAIATAMGARDLLEVVRAETEQLGRERDAIKRECENWATIGLGVAEERDRCADECERLWAGIAEIADRLDGWTDHDGIGPEDALRALLNPEGSNEDGPRACLRCGWTGPGHELRAHLATCE